MDLLTANDKQGKYPSSYYAEHARHLEDFPCLNGEIQADVCVVGGGFTGLSTALHLAQSGYKVTLLEAQRLGFGASGRNGGQVSGGQRMDQEGLEATLSTPMYCGIFRRNRLIWYVICLQIWMIATL